MLPRWGNFVSQKDQLATDEKLFDAAAPRPLPTFDPLPAYFSKADSRLQTPRPICLTDDGVPAAIEHMRISLRVAHTGVAPSSCAVRMS